jgi:protein involved in polysaccharide export with SLBB domain
MARKLGITGLFLAPALFLLACTGYPEGAGTPLSALAANGKTVTSITIDQIPRYPTTIHPGDTLRIAYDYPREPESQREVPVFLVRPDGSFSFPFIGRVEAGGRTPDAVAADISKRLAKSLANPQVTVNIATSPSDRAYVGGEVRRPGPLDLTGGLTLQQAILYSGGLLTTADKKNVVVVRETPKHVYDVYIVDYDYIFGPEAARQPMRLARGDLVIVPPSATGQFLIYVDLYVNRIFGARNSAFGAVYNINATSTTAILP